MKNYYSISSNMSLEQGNTSWSNDTYNKESEDRYIVSRCMLEWINPKCENVTFTQTALYDNVDVECSCTIEDKKIDWNIEIKNYGKTQNYWGEETVYLKKDKLTKMFKRSEGKRLYLVAIVNGFAYLFDCGKIDWDKEVYAENKWQKITYLNPNSGYAYYYTYSIPLRLAHKKLDVTKFQEEWDTGKQYLTFTSMEKTIELYEHLIDGLQLIIKNQQEIIDYLLEKNGLHK